MEKRLAKANKTFLGVEDHGIMTLMIDVSYGGSSQGIGGYALDKYDHLVKERRGTQYGMEFLRRTMLAFGVTKWEAIPGRTVYVAIENDRPIGILPLETEPGEAFMFSDISDMINE